MQTSWILIKENFINDLILMELSEAEIYDSQHSKQPPNCSMCNFQWYNANNNYN